MELFTGEKRKQKNKMKKKTKIIIGILIAAVIAAAGITWYVMNQKNQKTGNSSAEVVAWDVDIEEEEPSEEKGILIPGYTSMVMKANTKEQTVSYLIPVVAAQLTKSSGEASAVYSLMIMLLVFAILAILSSLYLVAQHKKIFGKSAL